MTPTTPAQQTPTLTPAQEERLIDIALRRPKMRGTRASVRRLKALGLVEFSDSLGCYVLTEAGINWGNEVARRRRAISDLSRSQP
jgi:DNA-binding IclR family transcriptional regulator